MATKVRKDKEIQIVDFRYDQGIRGRIDSDISSTLTTKSSGVSGIPMIMKTNKEDSKVLRIRKLTPKECIRLMGFTDEDYQALKEIGLSDSAIYHCAGDSIVTTCLVAMIYPFISEDRKGHQKVIQSYVEKEIIEK